MHRKNAQDAKRAKVFGKFLREISVAIREGGGSDLMVNASLRAAVARAKQANVPNANIDRALKGNADGDRAYESLRYEGLGPAGSAFIVDIITDNRNRSACDIRTIFHKNGGRMADSNSVSFLFERKGMILYQTEQICTETLMLAALDAGSEDIEEDSRTCMIFCALEKLHQISNTLEIKFGAPQEAQAVWWPSDWIEFSDAETYETVEKLRSALDQHEDVQNVWDNVS